MDQAAARAAADRPGPMAVQEKGALSPDPAVVDPAEHNVVFTSLVQGDDDIVGLVAYSIYKQNKYDWLQAYGRLEGRMPEPAEVHSYLLGESTARRLGTYRHLAQAVLDGRGPDSARTASRTNPDPHRPAVTSRRVGITPGRSSFQLSSRAIVGLCIALVVLLALLWLLRSGAPLPPPTPAR